MNKIYGSRIFYKTYVIRSFHAMYNLGSKQRSSLDTFHRWSDHEKSLIPGLSPSPTETKQGPRVTIEPIGVKSRIWNAGINWYTTVDYTVKFHAFLIGIML